ncbi:hypothetical protein P168DRAFT_305047 [Aspergillus campestris IBT 28561]|uniref:Gamma-glutamylcyclotransferase AIG2-like domain-containing protein n=1 Tax=Aspergillus campestris (strain IBT 28561) TaxID=1392248 RepID=A0A2I1D1F4_ASPC2|nr:uncharacterized protein P168DRAFT_305047 [Aspergillus campestris IBT 28561]PKY03711.1 hypothetical protein P168DRAFT_305047 [Aspergillus campestris IBT 28561]
MAENIPPNLPPPSLMARKFMAWDGTVPPLVKEEDRPFREKWFFFYGPLANPEILIGILNRSEKPELPHAIVFGHEILYWGDLPAAIQKGAENPIDGVVCKIESQEELNRLEAYMTKMFRVDGCMAWRDDHSEVPGFVFIWDADMSLLSETPRNV